MSESIPSSPDKWLHHYQPKITKPAATLGELSDGNIAATSFADHDSLASPENSGAKKIHSKKPTQRKPRVLKRQPVTILNASKTDFRALVQQYTGRQIGPINLNFASNDFGANSSAATFGYSYQNYGAQPQKEKQQSMLTLKNANTNISSILSNSTTRFQTFKDFSVDHICLDEVAEELLSKSNEGDDYFGGQQDH